MSGAPTETPPSRQVRWTHVLAYTGAFLVIVAAAIFTVAVWETVSTTAKLGFLGAFTVGFYAAGVWAWRAGMGGGGVALAAVGAAMLLFDGWIAIDGYGLAGPWPWAVLLVVLSAVYWLTEVWMSGRFFGITGAAAQVGWWWLLGQGLGWTVAPRLAGISAAAAAWALVSERAREKEGFESLASVLRVAAPVVAAGAAVGVLFDVPIGPVRWVDVLSAAVIAVTLAIIANPRGHLWRALSALGSLPLLVALSALAATDGSSWTLVGALALVALATGGWGLARGGPGYVGVALLAELGAWLALADVVGLHERGTVALLAAVALTWLTAGTLMEGDGADRLAPGAASASRVAAAGGWVLLALATVAAFTHGDLVFEQAAASRGALLAWWMLGAWLAAGVLTRAAFAGPVALTVSVWAVVATTTAWIDPTWDASVHPLAVLLVVAVWRYARSVTAMVGFEQGAPWVSRAFVVGVTVWCFGLAATAFPTGSWGTAAIPVLLAAFWIGDAFFARTAWLLAGVGPSLALASFVAASVLVDGSVSEVIGPAACAAAGGAALVGGVAIATRRAIPAAGAWLAVPGTGAVTIALLALGLEASYLAAGFALVALAWAASAVAARLVEFAVPAALSVTVSIAALLAWGDVSPTVTVIVLTLASASMLAPTLSVRSGVAASLATAGVFTALGTAVLAVMSVAGMTNPGTWAHLGWWGGALSMLWLGVALVTVAEAYGIEAAEYPGAAAVLLAAWFVLGAIDIGVVAPYAACAGVFVAAVSLRWSSRVEHRRAYPLVDWVAVAAFVGVPVLAALSGGVPADVWVNSLWAVGLAIAAMAAGVAWRVRAYLFGAVAGLVAVSVWRSFFVLVEFWWVVLGLIGLGMLVIALTWERQQLVLRRTGSRLQELLGDWR